MKTYCAGELLATFPSNPHCTDCVVSERAQYISSYRYRLHSISSIEHEKEVDAVRRLQR